MLAQELRCQVGAVGPHQSVQFWDEGGAKEAPIPYQRLEPLFEPVKLAWEERFEARYVAHSQDAAPTPLPQARAARRAG